MLDSMAIYTNLNDTIRDMRREFADLGGTQFKRAVSRAINRTASAANVQARKEIRAEYRIKPTRIKQAIKVARKSTPDSLRADVTAKGNMIPVMEFKQGRVKLSSGGGVSVNIRGERKLLRGAFIARMRSGHIGVFARADTAKGYDNHEFMWRHVRLNSTGKDLPIAEVKTVGVPKAMGNAAVSRAMQRKTREKFPGVLRHELTRRLAQQQAASSTDEQD